MSPFRDPVAPAPRLSFARRLFAPALFLLLCSGQIAGAAEPLTVKPVVEKKVTALPEGPLFWRIETFPTLDQACAAATGATSLAAEISGRAWLFTLAGKSGADKSGAGKGGASSGGTGVAEIGPIPIPKASAYLLRINHAFGPPGAKTAVHSHPGSEAFYVLAGRLGQRTPRGISHVDAGQWMNGQGGDIPMEVFSSGTTDLDQLVMFVVDAGRPFSEPAKLD